MSNRLSRTESRVAVLNVFLQQHDTGGVFGLVIMKDTGFGSGTVYPILAKLEQVGWVVSNLEDSDLAAREKRPRRRYYRLTGLGENAAPAYCSPRTRSRGAGQWDTSGASA